MKMALNFRALVLVSLLGCNKSAPPKDVSAKLVQKQHQENMAIGWVDGQKLELIVFGTKPNLRDYTLSAEEAQRLTTEARKREKPLQIEGGSDAQQAPDGKWITYRTAENKFVLADSAGKVQRTPLAGDKILTALYWSPNSE